MYSGDWTPTDAAGSGWGPEEDQLLATIYAGMDAGTKKLYDDPVLGSKLRGTLRQKVLENRAPQKQKELNTDFEYGGDPNKAKNDADFFRQQALDAQRRPGEVIDTGRADEWRLATQQDRLAQLEATGLMRDRAMGLVPSISGQRADLDIQRGVADQSSIQAGARGPAAMALAAQQAGNNSAALTSRISNDAQVNTAQERMDAERAWFEATSGMRGQDTQSQTVDLQTAQAQAEINAQQRAQNDAYSQGMYGNEIGINQSQLAAHGNRQSLKAGQQAAAQQVQAQAQARADAQRDRVIGMIGSGVSMGMSAVGTGLSKTANSFRGSDGSDTWKSDERAKQGVRPVGLYSDERAKSNAVQLGYAAGLMASTDPNDDPIRRAKADAWDEGHGAALKDAQKLSKMTPQQLKELADQGHPLAQTVRDMRANAWDEGRSSFRVPENTTPAPAQPADPYAGVRAQAQGLMGDAQVRHQAQMDRGPAVNDFTQQLADGLAPTQYEYKPGFGPPGAETGIIAQRAARNPLTAGAVYNEPGTGLLALDPNRSLKLSLAAAGSNAQEIQGLKQQLGLMAPPPRLTLRGYR